MICGVLLAALLICWDPNVENDLLGYWVQTAELHVDHWIDCPCGTPPQPDCTVPPAQCPVYNPFVWETVFTGYNTFYTRSDCAHEPHSLCVFKWPRAQDFAGNMSAQPSIGPDFDWGGTCP